MLRLLLRSFALGCGAATVVLAAGVSLVAMLGYEEAQVDLPRLYDTASRLPSAVTVVRNDTGRPEFVVRASEL